MTNKQKYTYVQSQTSHIKARHLFNFSVRLLQNISKKHKNALVSPVSLIAALALAEIGASENTLREFEFVIGENSERLIELLNIVFGDSKAQNLVPTDVFSISARLLEGQKRSRTINYANSVWLKDTDKVTYNPAYPKKCKALDFTDYHHIPFDANVCGKINEWVNNATDGEINQIIHSIDKDSMCLLMNALLFEDSWDKPYDPAMIKQRPFYASDGSVKDIDFMCGEEPMLLLDNNARGFIKQYRNRRYEFIALLPDKGVPLMEYISNLDGDKLLSIIESPIERSVEVFLPKLTTETTLNLKDTLKEMGLVDAFNPIDADFSGIGVAKDLDSNICISDIKQFNKVEVDENGTKAVAVTYVDTKYMFSCYIPEPYHLCFDRPFLYMIHDREANIPLFIGTINNFN